MAVTPEEFDKMSNGTPLGKVLESVGFTKMRVAEGFWDDARASRTLKVKGVMLPSILPDGVEVLVSSTEETVLTVPDLAERRKALIEVSKLRNFYPAVKVDVSEGLDDIFGKVIERVDGRHRGKLPREAINGDE